MLCVTGGETTVTQLRQRLERVATRAAASGQSWLQEVRLDALVGALDDAFALLERFAGQLVVCCRPPRQGGAFGASEGDRLALLERAARCGVAYLDLEDDCPEADLRRVTEVHPGKLILSWHDFAGCPGDLDRRIARMVARGADVPKVAVTVEDAARLEPLLGLGSPRDQPTVIIGMGLAGLLTRCRYPAFGAPWTYVKADAASGTAPGQLSLDDALAMGLPEAASTPFFALVGGPQIADAIAPKVYNRLFRRLNRPWSYLSVCTSGDERVFPLLRRLGALGLSVTTPCEAAALTYAGAGADALAQQVQAANALRWRDEVVEATNTDAMGLAQPLAEATQISWITGECCTAEQLADLRQDLA